MAIVQQRTYIKKDNDHWNPEPKRTFHPNHRLLGPLGAYEVGAFKALAKKIPEIDAKNQEAGRQLFDIVTGTSIGAINAAILVSYFNFSVIITSLANNFLSLSLNKLLNKSIIRKMSSLT